jgi:hypothetical protein
MPLTTQDKTNWYKALAFFACLGVGGSLILNIFNVGPVPITDSTLFQNHFGVKGTLPRVIDFISYFTIWSNILVIYVSIRLAKNPLDKRGKMPILIPTSLVMITITGILYNVLIAPVTPPKGLNIATSIVQHGITPVLTLLVWFKCGPRGLINLRKIPHFYIIPITFLLYILIRSSIIKQWPYAFLDEASLGWTKWLITVAMIIIFGLVIIGILSLIDRLQSKRNAVKS